MDMNDTHEFGVWPTELKISESGTLDEYYEEIFEYYYMEQKSLKETKILIESLHKFDAPSWRYYNKLSQWGLYKNNKRSEVVALLRKKEDRDAIGKKSVVTANGKIIKMWKIEKSAKSKQNSITDVVQDSMFEPLLDTQRQINYRTPSPVQYNPPSPELLGVLEEFLWNVTRIIKGSFEQKLWKSAGTDQIIHSSPCHSIEKRSIHETISELKIGCTASKAGNNELANAHWNQAFDEISTLVKGKYHDNIPNLIEQINDLKTKGHPCVASSLKNQIGQIGSIHYRGRFPHAYVYTYFEKLPLEHMKEIEEKVIELFKNLFPVYLEQDNYSSFVMLMKAARTRLNHNEWVPFQPYLPALSSLDSNFGPSDRRPMDVIRIRIEILFQRSKYREVERRTSSLIRRAQAVEDDPWNCFYFLTKAWYYRGSSQAALENHDSATFSLLQALKCELQFAPVDPYDTFKAEKCHIAEQLEKLNAMPTVTPASFEASVEALI